MTILVLVTMLVGYLLTFPLGQRIENLFQSAYVSDRKGPLDTIAEILDHYSMTANILTWFRLCGSILIFLLNCISLILYGSFLDPSFLAISGVLLALTDPFDGKLARIHGPTDDGKLLDSIADKAFMVTFSMIFISVSWIGAMIVLAYLGYISSTIALNYFRAKGTSNLEDKFEANSFGKIKTCLQFPAVGLLYCLAIGILEDNQFFSAMPLVLLELSLFFELKSQIIKGKSLFCELRRKKALRVVN